MKIFLAQYCDCVHESSYSTISAHKTLVGAEFAVDKHKEEQEDEYNKNQEDLISRGIFTREECDPYERHKWEDYAIQEMELLE